MLDSILESLRVVSLKTKTNFRSVTTREVALFEGPVGWAEFSPFVEYDPTECVPWLVSAIESSLIKAPEAKRESVDVNATLPAVNGAERVGEILSWFPGCSVIKIKIGSNLDEDLIRISDALFIRPEAKIRLDVNGGWSVDQALSQLDTIYSRFDQIQYVEQPCATLDELKELKKVLPKEIKITGDEVLRKNPNPLALDLSEAVDILMLKVAPLGGIKRSKEIAEKHGLPIVVSSALESAVGISYGLKLAASFDEQEFSAGLATGELLAEDVATLPVHDGAISVATVAPSEHVLEQFSAAPERVDWWRERIRKTWSAGAQRWVEQEGWSQ